LSTGLDPAMTLGCGGYGGNITSDNISPRHLLNIKRLAYEVTPTVSRWDRPGAGIAQSMSLASVPPPAGITADALTRRIDDFLGSRGFRNITSRTGVGLKSDFNTTSNVSSPTSGQAPLDFVCEEDVRLAIQAGRKLIVSERAIVTPAARDLGEQHRVFSFSPWRG
jgi:hypothetical protein